MTSKPRFWKSFPPWSFLFQALLETSKGPYSSGSKTFSSHLTGNGVEKYLWNCWRCGPLAWPDSRFRGWGYLQPRKWWRGEVLTLSGLRNNIDTVTSNTVYIRWKRSRFNAYRYHHKPGELSLSLSFTEGYLQCGTSSDKMNQDGTIIPKQLNGMIASYG